jgi:Malic enzyme, NAD binding domain
LRDFQIPYAKNRAQLGVPVGDRLGLVETIKLASATILLGCSTVHSAFTREVIEAMTASTDRPDDEIASKIHEDVAQAVRDTMWTPQYRP